MSILDTEGLKVVKAGVRGKFKETGTLTLSVNFTLCGRKGLSVNMKKRLELDGLQFRSRRYT
jgi:hypothetical protein